MENIRQRIEERLSQIFVLSETAQAGSGGLNDREEIVAAHKYPVVAGGKRIRPCLVCFMAGAVGGSSVFPMVLTPAAACELVHTYSLVHDDLPCMDNDDMRRGRATTHKVYGDAKGLLVGDGLLTKAFEILALLPEEHEGVPGLTRLVVEAVKVLARGSGVDGMVYGQWLDLNYTAKTEEVSWEIVRDIHINKTGRMLGVAFEMGVLCGLCSAQGADFDPGSHDAIALRGLAREIGASVGLAFQIIDDILDATSTVGILGKTPGKDAAQRKPTAVDVLGFDKARELAQKHTIKATSTLNALFAHRLCQPLSSEKTEWQKVTQGFIIEMLQRRN